MCSTKRVFRLAFQGVKQMLKSVALEGRKTVL